ncbi:hypothetical protein H310_09414 [Aphanomyces invadans]|uniref:Uncharacterized protein n=1 Tax=Aphanomyces invadans TaxID=157072 RepID=A0A024TU33_9STRA|nr:hypothetical protein H310_09414 [Aphanomyces invadans]ETV97489.1 hypothetical protein H310_09414 [Aphanomyces invadans]|eukprot:XP_008873698.1 hypothetical protein H310_09414 [Aphanomyces invadans]
MEVEEEQNPSRLTTIMPEVSDRIQALQDWTMVHEHEMSNLARETTDQLSTLRTSNVDDDNRLGDLARRLSTSEDLMSDSNTQLQELVADLSTEKGFFQDRIQLLETRIDQQQLNFASRLGKLKSKASSADTAPSIPAASPQLEQPDDPPTFIAELKGVKDAVLASEHSKSFGIAVKYTSVPTSDEQAQCEFFIKQLLDQATRCQLNNEERELLLGLKLSADKAHPNLNKWWISYSKTKNGDVWTEILAGFMDQRMLLPHDARDGRSSV